MLEIAKQNKAVQDIGWNVVDMTDIPYQSNSFDLVVCQFGIMLVPEKLKALSEIYRVLANGGQLIFNVWGNIQNNKVWDIGSKVIAGFLDFNPILQDPGPFSLSQENDVIRLLNKAGFSDVKVTRVNKTGSIETAAKAAKGFIEGLPVYVAIHKKNPSLIPEIIKAMELEFINQLGNNPMRSPLQALVFETNKP